MGITLYCDKMSFSSSYTYWDQIREGILATTIKYIEAQNFEIDETDEDDVNHKCPNYNLYLKELYEIKMNVKNIISVANLRNSIRNINTLIYFDIKGIHTISNKSDCDGFYSPGDSYDICSLLDKIKDSFDKETDIYDSIYNNDENRFANSVYSVFKESMNINKKVKIC